MRLLRFLATRANPLAILVGLGFLTVSALMVDTTFGIAALGGALILAGLDVRSLR